MSTVSDGSLFSLHGRSARAQRFLARFSSATYIALGLADRGAQRRSLDRGADGLRRAFVPHATAAFMASI
jgi:hypothetical protein